MDLNKLKEDVEKLDLRVEKDYIRFSEIRETLIEEYKDRMERGRVPEYDFILEKERKSFNGNYPSQGYEIYNTFEEHRKKYYPLWVRSGFKNFEQEQYMYDDLDLQYQRRRIFGNN